jgi:nucleoside 2-deoxyribosyltransferase
LADNSVITALNTEKDPLGKHGSRARANLSALIRSLQFQKPKGPWLKLNFFSLESGDELRNRFDSIRTPRFHEMADKLLLAFEDETKHAGDEVVLDRRLPEWEAKAWALNEKELHEILSYLKAAERIQLMNVEAPTKNIIHAKILPIGWRHLEDLAKQRPESEQGFVAMPFSDEFKLLFENGINPAIWHAGYKPLHIGRQDDLGRIDAQIEVEIKRSKFVVADLTHENSGAVYEAGYARGYGIPTILTRQKSELDDRSKNHFDIRQIRTLAWEDIHDLADFVEKLSYRIQLNCGQGPVKIPEEERAKLAEKYPGLFRTASDLDELL